MIPNICLNYLKCAYCTLRTHCARAMKFAFPLCPPNLGNCTPTSLRMMASTLWHGDPGTPPGSALEAVFLTSVHKTQSTHTLISYAISMNNYLMVASFYYFHSIYNAYIMHCMSITVSLTKCFYSLWSLINHNYEIYFSVISL